MGTELKAAVVITGKDRITAVLGGISRGVKSLGREVSHEATRISIAGRAIKKALAPDIASVKTIWNGLTRVVKGAAIGVGAAAAGIVVGAVAATRSYVEMADSLNDLSIRTGASVESIQEWRHVAQLSGSSAEEFDKGLERLSRSIGKMQAGKGGIIAKVAPDLAKALGRTDLTMDQKFSVLVSTLRKVEDPAKRAAIATALMGNSGRRLAEISASSADEVSGLRQEARSYGLVTAEGAQQAAELADAQDRLKASLGGLQVTIIGQLVPAITPMVNKLSQWVAANKNIIASRVGATLEWIVTTLKSVDWAGIGKSIADVYGGIKAATSAIGGFVESIGGWGVAIGALFAARVLPVVLKTIGALRTAAKLSAAQGAAGAAGGAAGGGGVIGKAAKLLLPAWMAYETWNAFSDHGDTPTSAATGEAAVGFRSTFLGGESEFPLAKLLGSALAQGREAQKPTVQLDIRMTPEVKKLFTATATSDPSKVGVRQVGGR